MKTILLSISKKYFNSKTSSFKSYRDEIFCCQKNFSVSVSWP